MEETRFSWMESWYLSNKTVNADTEFDIRIHYADGRTSDITGIGHDKVILYILNTTEKDDVMWITQYPRQDLVSIGIRK